MALGLRSEVSGLRSQVSGLRSEVCNGHYLARRRARQTVSPTVTDTDVLSSPDLVEVEASCFTPLLCSLQ